MTSKNENKKIKNLTMTELKKLDKKLDLQTRHEIEVGEDIYEVKVDKEFRKTKQHQLLHDLANFFEASNENSEILDLTTPYTSLLLIKHFTSIHVSDDIDEALIMLDILIDLEIFKKVLDLFPEDEVTKIYELLESAIQRMNENIDEYEEEKEELVESVESEQVKDMLADGE